MVQLFIAAPNFERTCKSGFIFKNLENKSCQLTHRGRRWRLSLVQPTPTNTHNTMSTLTPEQIATRALARWIAHTLSEECTSREWLHDLMEEVAQATSSEDSVVAFAINLDHRYFGDPQTLEAAKSA
jgi:hypothetical protein